MGIVVSGSTVEDYLRSVNGGYDDLNRNFYSDVYVSRDSETKTVFIRDWIPAHVRWKEFYEDSINDWVQSGSTFDRAEEYHEILRGFWARYESAMGKKPAAQFPGMPKSLDDEKSEIITPVLVIGGILALGYLVNGFRGR